MSLTFLPKSSAYSWKMSFDGHVLCQRMLIGPLGLDRRRRDGGGAVAPAASRNLRRVAVLESVSLLIGSSPPWIVEPRFAAAPSDLCNHRLDRLIPPVKRYFYRLGGVSQVRGLPSSLDPAYFY